MVAEDNRVFSDAVTVDTPEDVWWRGSSPSSECVGKDEGKNGVLPVLGALRVPEHCDLLTGSTCALAPAH